MALAVSWPVAVGASGHRPAVVELRHGFRRCCPREDAGRRRPPRRARRHDAGASSSSTTRRPVGCRATSSSRCEDLPGWRSCPEPSAERAREVLDRLVVVKLNGGLGTSMGLSGPKSLLEVKPGTSFLDVLAAQVLGLRERHGARLPLVLMNSPTRGPSLEALQRYDGLREQDVPLDFLQGREPKLRADDLSPVEWPANPELEWCPPGHGDLYTALAATGTLDALLDAGLRWASCRTRTTSARWPTCGSRHGWPTSGCRSRWRRCAARRPTARAATSPARRPGGAARDRAGARGRRLVRATSSGGATTTRTTSGSTCGAQGAAGRRPGARRRCR